MIFLLRWAIICIKAVAWTVHTYIICMYSKQYTTIYNIQYDLCGLIHWSQGDLNKIWIRNFHANVRDWWRRYISLIRLPSDGCHMNLPTISQHRLRWWLGAICQQDITWPNLDKVLRCHIMSLGHNELNQIYSDWQICVPSQYSYRVITLFELLTPLTTKMFPLQLIKPIDVYVQLCIFMCWVFCFVVWPVYLAVN